LVLSLASKYASGEDFDRSLLSGGEASRGFALLRRLGFHIERKDFVEDLLRQFLKQAEAADDLSTKSYPKSYRGLQVEVSFGKGNAAKIPWISLFGYGQKTSEGIYPVFLLYQDVSVLILAYGISETTDLTGVFCTIDKDEGGVKAIDFPGAATSSSGEVSPSMGRVVVDRPIDRGDAYRG
jgi:hypothetical protein